MNAVLKIFRNKISVLFILTFLISEQSMAQEKKQMVRLAKIKIDSAQVEKYNNALKEQMNAAIKNETGVLTYYAVADIKDPTIITILEIYADTTAYKLHIETAHFKKYKEAVKTMVKSLELVDVDIIASVKKSNM